MARPRGQDTARSGERGRRVIAPEEELLEVVRATARYEVTRLECAAEEVRAQVLKKRQERVLLEEADLQRISCYEAHLSRQMYQALHELKALQTRRRGAATPLARVDVQTKNTKQCLQKVYGVFL